MGDSADADLEPDEYGALVDVRDRSGIFALDFAFAKIVFTGVAIYALNVSADGDVFQRTDFDTQDAHQDLVAHMEAFHGVSQPVPR